MISIIYHRLTHRIRRIQSMLYQLKVQNVLRKERNLIGDSSCVTRTTLCGKNCIGDCCKLNFCQIGFASYMGSNCLFDHTIIGKYCSIARNVQVIAGNHPIHDFVAMHPAFYSVAMSYLFDYVTERKYKDCKYADEGKKVTVIIGNDVWIGANACILEGVTIGDGAVIGANALVTKDVAPYEVWGGTSKKTWRSFFTGTERISYFFSLVG